MFSGQVDFHTDLQPGDSFRVLFEKSSYDGQFSGYGAILGASITVDGRPLQAFRWEDPATGKAGYYDENGRSLKRFFLKSPLKFEPRVTSALLDAPVPSRSTRSTGRTSAWITARRRDRRSSRSPVARWSRRGYSGAGGNTVRLKHAGGFETYYLHLSSYGPGIRAGRARRAGTVDRPRRDDGFGDRPAPRLPAQAERRVRESRRGALTPGSGRADSRRAARDVHVVTRRRCSRACRRRSSPKPRARNPTPFRRSQNDGRDQARVGAVREPPKPPRTTPT